MARGVEMHSKIIDTEEGSDVVMTLKVFPHLMLLLSGKQEFEEGFSVCMRSSF